MTRALHAALGAGLAAVLACAIAPAVPAEEREPCRERDPLRRAFFGDLHVHTGLSLDAATQDTRARPADAYRFARGEPLGIQPFDAEGRPLRTLQLARPLDFAAVTDHAELFGELHICAAPGLPGHDSWVCRIYRRWPRLAFYVMNNQSSNSEAPTRFGFCGPDGSRCAAAARTPWEEVQRAAEAAYDRSAECAFTTFVGYEWTGGPGSKNIHRNVIFRGRTVPGLPISYYEAPAPALLWEALRSGCREAGTGCDVLVIPHNSNISGGLMFRTEGRDGAPLTAEGARTRARFEPLVELMQHKGDSECHPAFSEDELCGFEKLPYDDFAGKFVSWLADPPGPSNYVRHALGVGLVEGERLGANPFRFGLLASTDTHLAAAGFAEEARHPGHGGAGAPAGNNLPAGLPDDVEFNPGGLAVLWAETNTRGALFDAMRRREAYGTSGPRLTVRFFGGWDYPHDLCEQPGLAARGYASGVPMGGVLPAREEARAPVFAVSALADGGAPGGVVPLERIQIVKGWVEDGDARERVLDVAGAPLPEVDPATCRVDREGPRALCRVWRDPEFDPDAPAFYYARVLERPTCRWHTRQCRAAGVDCADPAALPEGFQACCRDDVPRTLRERAWTSPIWYDPDAHASASAEASPPADAGAPE